MKTETVGQTLFRGFLLAFGAGAFWALMDALREDETDGEEDDD